MGRCFLPSVVGSTHVAQFFRTEGLCASRYGFRRRRLAIDCFDRVAAKDTPYRAFSRSIISPIEAGLGSSGFRPISGSPRTQRNPSAISLPMLTSFLRKSLGSFGYVARFAGTATASTKSKITTYNSPDLYRILFDWFLRRLWSLSRDRLSLD